MFRFLTTLLVLLSPALAVAEPMYTPLHEVYAKTKSVVIARMLDADQPKTGMAPAVIRVDEVIQGKMGLGKLKTGLCGGHARVKNNVPFVAFLDASGGLCFAAVPLSGGSVYTGLLQMRGFYDFNAHLVGPAMASLPQIRATLKGKTYTYKLRGKLHVLDPKTGGWVPTRHEVTARCVFDIKKGCTKTQVGGLAWVKGVPKPALSMSAWDPAMKLTYHTGWPRPLVLSGAVMGWDKKRGEHRLRLEVTMPDLLTKEHLEAYLKNPKIAYGIWRYTLTFKDGTVWKMSDGHDYNSGLRLRTDKGRRHTYNAFSFNAQERKVTFADKGAPVLEFQTRAADFSQPGTQRRFHYAVILGGVTAKVLKGPRKGQRAKLKLEGVEWKEPIRAP